MTSRRFCRPPAVLGAVLIAVALGLAGVVRPAHAAYLESDSGRSPVPPERILPPPPPPLPPDGDSPVARLLSRVTVGQPAWYRGTALFPLVDPRPSRTGQPMTLDEALRQGALELAEEAEGRVSGLRVRNRADRHVFLMAGEYLSGGKQNRIVREDVLLPPRSGSISVPVYCGEERRWSQAPASFSSGGILAGKELRSLSARESPQGAVWGEIDRMMDAAGVASPTRSYEALHGDRRVRGELDEAVRCWHPVRRPETVGVVAVMGHRVLGLDLFASPELLDRLWEKICRSYAVEPVVRPMEREDSERRRMPLPPFGAVEMFLDAVRQARFVSAGTPGEGQRLEIESSHVDGTALIWNGEVLHAAVFPGRSPDPEPMPYPVPPMPRPPVMPYDEEMHPTR